MYICVDFDGTIVDNVFPQIGKPAPGAVKWLKRFNELEAKLILFTMRSDNHVRNVLTEAVDFIEAQGVVLFGINHNPDQSDWTSSPKAHGNVYIDDAGVLCPLIHPVGFKKACVDWAKVGPCVEDLVIAKKESHTIIKIKEL